MVAPGYDAGFIRILVQNDVEYASIISGKPIMGFLTWSRISSPIDSANFPFKL